MKLERETGFEPATLSLGREDEPELTATTYALATGIWRRRAAHRGTQDGTQRLKRHPRALKNEAFLIPIGRSEKQAAFLKGPIIDIRLNRTEIGESPPRWADYLIWRCSSDHGITCRLSATKNGELKL